jgi:hypothetical protein
MLHIFAKKNTSEVRQWQACYKAQEPQAQIATRKPARRASELDAPPQEGSSVATGRRKHAKLAKVSDAPAARRHYTTSRYLSPLPEDNQ